MTHCYIAQLANAGFDADHVVVKIGFSENPRGRFQALVAMSWIGPSRIYATTRRGNTPGREIEQFLHRHLRTHNIHHEWFHMPRSALEHAKEIVWDRYGETFELLDVSDVETLVPEEVTA